MATIRNSAEGQASGTTVTSVNSGGTSGIAFDAVGINGTGTTFTFDNTQAAHGTKSYKTVLGTGSFCWAYINWDTALVAFPVSTLYTRQYMYFTANPSSGLPLTAWAQSTAANVGYMGLNSNGQIYLLDANFLSAGLTINSVPLNQWFRIEAKCTGHASAGVLEVKLFNNLDDVTATEVVTATGLNTTGLIDTVSFGTNSASGQNNFTYWSDDFGASDVGYLGPGTGAGIGVGTAYDVSASANAVNAAAGAALGTGIVYTPVLYVPKPLRNNFSDNAIPNTLGATIVETDLAMYCAAPPSGYPSPPFVVKINQFSSTYEAVLVVAGSGTSADPWTIQRGYQSTLARQHNAGAPAVHQIGSADVLDLLISIAILGVGPPEGVVAAIQGTLYLRSDASVGSRLYIKETGGSGATGWVNVSTRTLRPF